MSSRWLSILFVHQGPHTEWEDSSPRTMANVPNTSTWERPPRTMGRPQGVYNNTCGGVSWNVTWQVYRDFVKMPPDDRFVPNQSWERESVMRTRHGIRIVLTFFLSNRRMECNYCGMPEEWYMESVRLWRVVIGPLVGFAEPRRRLMSIITCILARNNAHFRLGELFV
jgi:hypothetical protein